MLHMNYGDYNGFNVDAPKGGLIGCSGTSFIYFK
jgi:hypothetical protein